MANKKISELNPTSTPSGVDVIPIVSSNETQKITFDDLHSKAFKQLNVSSSNITGNDQNFSAPALGFTTDGEPCFLPENGQSGDWELLLRSQSGVYKANIELANASDIVLDSNVIGEHNGRIVVGDGITVGSGLGSTLNSDAIQAFFYTGIGSDVDINSGQSNLLQRIPVPCSYTMRGDFPLVNSGVSSQTLSNMFYLEADFFFRFERRIDLALFMQPQITISKTQDGSYGQFTHSTISLEYEIFERENVPSGNPIYGIGQSNSMGSFLVNNIDGGSGPEALFDDDLTLTGFGPYSNSPDSDDYAFQSSTLLHSSDTSAITILSETGAFWVQPPTNEIRFIQVKLRGIYKASINYLKKIPEQTFNIDFYACNATSHAFTGIANTNFESSNAAIKIFPIA